MLVVSDTPAGAHTPPPRQPVFSTQKLRVFYCVVTAYHAFVRRVVGACRPVVTSTKVVVVLLVHIIHTRIWQFNARLWVVGAAWPAQQPPPNMFKKKGKNWLACCYAYVAWVGDCACLAVCGRDCHEQLRGCRYGCADIQHGSE